MLKIKSTKPTVLFYLNWRGESLQQFQSFPGKSSRTYGETLMSDLIQLLENKGTYRSFKVLVGTFILESYIVKNYSFSLSFLVFYNCLKCARYFSDTLYFLSSPRSMTSHQIPVWCSPGLYFLHSRTLPQLYFSLIRESFLFPHPTTVSSFMHSIAQKSTHSPTVRAFFLLTSPSC